VNKRKKGGGGLNGNGLKRKKQRGQGHDQHQKSLGKKTGEMVAVKGMGEQNVDKGPTRAQRTGAFPDRTDGC